MWHGIARKVSTEEEKCALTYAFSLCGSTVAEARDSSGVFARNVPGVCLGDGQTVAYLEDMRMTGLASAWAMARRRTKEYRHKVDAATRCSGVCPHT